MSPPAARALTPTDRLSKEHLMTTTNPSHTSTACTAQPATTPHGHSWLATRWPLPTLSGWDFLVATGFGVAGSVAPRPAAVAFLVTVGGLTAAALRTGRKEDR